MKLTIKKSKYIIGFLALSLFGCQDFVELLPTDTIVEDTAIENLADLNAAATGSYAAFTAAAYYGGNMSIAPDWVSDDVTRSVANLGQGVFFYNYDYNPASDNLIWNSAYNALNRINIVLNRIPLIEGDQVVRNNLRGEMLFLRALAHFDLNKFFAGNYDANALGIPLQLTPPVPSQEPARNTQGEVYASIIADLTEARGLITQDKGRVKASRAAVDALLARVRLYQGDYQGAIAAAEAVVGNNPASPSFPLATGNDYEGMWRSNENTTEVIFKLSMPVGSAALGSNWWAENNNIAYYSPANDLVSLYDEVNDVRFRSFFNLRTRTDANAVDDLVIKYRGNALGSNALPANPGLVDIKILRTSELALILAEAYFQTGNQAAARGWLNAVRAARITGFTDLGESGTTLENAIRVERRKEFAHEGHRFFDLRRWGLDVVRGDDCNAAPGSCFLQASDFRFVFPIPQDEQFANSNMVQNPGY